jgi:hypothetical protein
MGRVSELTFNITSSGLPPLLKASFPPKST